MNKKILSIEKNMGGYDVLIPCYMYEIVTSEAYSGNNILEYTVARLIEVDSKYKNIDELVEILGIQDREILSKKSFRDLLKLILSKILNKENDANEIKKKAKLYQIYQERYSGSVLKYITDDINKFIISTKENGYKIEFADKKAYYQRPNNTIKAPIKDDVFKAIQIHNKYAEYKINTNINLQVETREEIYLHCKVYLGRDREFNITNGFNGAFSLHLKDIIEKNCDNILRKMRENEYTDEKKKSNYRKKYGDLRDELTYNLKQFANNNKASDLYNAFENYFKYKVQKHSYSICKILNNEEDLKKFAKKMGFKIPNNSTLFKNYGKDDLKSHFAILLINEDKDLSEIARLDSNFLYLLTMLHIERNAQLHGGKKHTEDMDIKELNHLKGILETIVKIKTEFQQKESINHANHNGIVLLEKDLSKDLLDNLSDTNIGNLAAVYDAFDNLNSLNIESFEAIVNNLYKVCENLLMRWGEIYIDFKEKDKLFTKIKKLQDSQNDTLKYVKDEKIQAAIQNKGSSLGAYMLVYIALEKIDSKELNSMNRLISLREHANHKVEVLQKTNIKELESIKQDAINFIKKCVKDITT